VVQKDSEITGGTNDSVAMPLDVASSKRPGGRLQQFVQDVRMELKRVSWPTFDHVKGTTIITLIAVVFFTIYLYVVDHAIVQLGRLLNWVVNWLLSLLGIA
jgi:preprotein translocase SecE subunit